MSDCFMKFIKRAFGEMIIRFCLSLDLLNGILSPSKFILMKICIVVADFIITLLVPAKVL